ncbi:MAG: ABC transporter ATP-binding protein [Bacteroidetes bacterium]|nr:MAG: ABC transporter ATP-binding protein [Bacteroidota bacterium]
MALKREFPSDLRESGKTTFKDSLQSLRMLRPFFRMIWDTSSSLTTANVLLRLVKAALPVAMLYIGKLIIDEVILQVGADVKQYDLLWRWLAIEFGLALLSDLLNRLISLTDALLGDLFANRTSVLLMEKAARLDLAQFEDPDFYDKLERARRQTTGRVVLMSQVLSQLQDIVSIIFLGSGLVIFEPILLIFLIVAILPSFISESYFSKTSYSLVRSWTPERRELDYIRYVGATDVTAKEVKIFNLSDFLTKRFARLADQYYQANRKLSIRRTFWGSILHTLGDVTYYGAYVLIVFRTVGGLLTVGDMTFLSGTFAKLRNQLQAILSRFSKIAESTLYLKDYFDFMEMEPHILEDGNALPFPGRINDGIVFENVGFKYPNTDVWAVRNVSFKLDEGEKLALVGENGAGKTTLVKLLARLYDPTEGRILIDGVDLKEIKLSDLRLNIGVIFQDFVRFHLSAAENIAIGNIPLKENRSMIESSAHKSLANQVIEKLPEEYEQMLGKRFKGGVDLSGGEWQKIALARAYMRDAQILILDEPTAALDARAEYEVFLRFTDLTRGKSAVIISHRFSTVRMADRILVLKDGQMNDLGTHQELMAKEGLYAELFDLQAKGYK